MDILRTDGTYIGTLTGQAVPDAASKTGRAAYTSSGTSSATIM